MDSFAAAKQISTAELPPFSLTFEIDEGVLRVNKSKITSENTVNGNPIGNEGNRESSKVKNTLFWVFSQFRDHCFNT